jgi:hypothetical protein
VRGRAAYSAVISLLFISSCPSAFAGGQRGFSIKVFTSPDDQFWTNSIIVEGVHEVMLIDAQLTKTSAEKVLHEIRSYLNNAATECTDTRAGRSPDSSRRGAPNV